MTSGTVTTVPCHSFALAPYPRCCLNYSSMGDSNKPSGGQLKDFRVHRGRVIDEQPASGTPSSSTSSPTPATPRQSTVSRQSNVTEWSSRGMDSNLEKMWQEWGNDLVTETVDLSKPASAASRSPNVPVDQTPSSRSQALSNPIQGEARGPLSAGQAPSLDSSAAYSTNRVVAAEDSFSISLALEERRMEREGVVDFSNTHRKQEMLKLYTTEYAKFLQAQFRREIELFNEARRSAASAIQLYKISKTEADFMLFRNGVKLVVSATQAGRIHFGFNQYLGQVLAPSHSPQLEMEAQWGSLDQLVWTYRGEKIEAKDIVRYFLTEFVKQSYR